MKKSLFFLTVVIFSFSCTSCDPDLTIKPQVTISQAENISNYSATLVASVVPNSKEVSAIFSYQANNSAWVNQIVPISVTANESSPVKMTLDLSDLQSGTNYRFTMSAKNSAGLTLGDTVSFLTTGTPKTLKSVIVLNAATEITKTSAKFSAEVIPNQESEISYEYQKENSGWVRKILPGEFSGIQAIKIDFDLSLLDLNANYNFRVISKNVAGEVISSVGSFQTYAVSDWDGNLYHTVTIGTQTWLKENFKGTHYANGDPIPNVTNLDDWGKLTTGAYCYYDNNPENGKVYGGLYNFWVGADPRGLIVGFHTPTYEEFDDLRIFVDNGDMNSAGIKMMETGNSHWYNPKRVANNSTGFTALPGGQNKVNFTTLVRKYNGLNSLAVFWTVSIQGPYANAPFIHNEDCFFFNNGDTNMANGFSLRLIK